MVWGGYSLTRLPIDAVPDITNNQVQIITVSPSLAAPEVERLITFPVEQTMATIPHITEMRSFSRFGLSLVTIVFTDDTDVYWARQQVNERLAQATALIPQGAGIPEIGPLTTGLGEIYQYILRVSPGLEDQYTLTDLRTIQDWIVRRQLLGTEGVADVSSFGGYMKQYEIVLAPDKLLASGVTVTEIFDALERNNQNTGGAYIDRKPYAFFIRSEGLVESLEDIGNIVIRSMPSGLPVQIRHVAEVRFGHANRYGGMAYNDEGEAVGAVVMMLKGANSSEVIGNIKERIAQIQESLPQGITIEPYLDRTKLVNGAIGTVTRNLAEGALIVVFVLVLMLGNFRAGLLVASVIPLSMLFAVGMMTAFGVSGNLMSLGAIDFGLIVDGAVIIVEATLHHLQARQLALAPEPLQLASHEMDNEVQTSASRMMRSSLFGQIIILIVYLPIWSLVGIEGKMFKPMAETVSFAILGALLLSLTYVPAAASLILSRKNHMPLSYSEIIMSFFHRVFRPTLRYALDHRRTVLAASVMLFGAGVWIFTELGGEFIPTLDEGDFAVETRIMPGSSLSQSIETVQKSSRVLLDNFPEVEKVIGKTGTAEIPMDPMPIEASDLIVVLKPRDEWTSARSRDELAGKMSARLEEMMPGVEYGFQQPIQMRFNELMTGARQDVVVKIYGEDLDLLAEYAGRLGRIVRSIEGAQDPYVEQVTGLSQLVVRIDRDRLARYGLSVEDVNRVIRAGFSGEAAGLVYENERRFELVIRLHESERRQSSDLGDLPMRTSSGQTVPLRQVANVTLESGPNQIQREDARRRIMVGFNVRGRDVQSIVEVLMARIRSELPMAPGYYVRVGGTFKNLEEARGRLIIAVPVALALIFALLFFTFNSIRESLLIYSAIPLSSIGGIIALWIRGMPFSISAGVGFIALFGVAVLNGIVLVAEFNRLAREGLTDAREIVRKGTTVRLRPVIMTALVASLGFLPMALSQSSGAEVQRPLATVVIGGLISATLLTLIVLPVLFTYFSKLATHER
jgi:cobalt-zinc-cadmium resistance protein CzcA